MFYWMVNELVNLFYTVEKYLVFTIKTYPSKGSSLEPATMVTCQPLVDVNLMALF